MNTMTTEQAQAAILAFETTTLPPMSRAWDALRVAYIEASKALEASK
jgi:hypothetical protein